MSQQREIHAAMLALLLATAMIVGATARAGALTISSDRMSATADPAQPGKGTAKATDPGIGQLFTPIGPCRVVDTRNTGGPISAGETRNYYFYSIFANYDWSFQGGIAGPVSSVCPGTFYPGGSVRPAAAVVTITAVSPSDAGNYILWSGVDPIPTISALNWTGPGQILANTTVVVGGDRTGTGAGGSILDFAVKYNGPSGSAHFIADVVGYVMPNAAQSFDCQSTAPRLGTVGPGTSGAVAASACPSGYAVVGGLCDSSNYVYMTQSAEYRLSGAWTCSYANHGPSSYSVYARSLCCRVPGAF